jgi:hypothetical protein
MLFKSLSMKTTKKIIFQLQIPLTVSTIILSGRTQSFVALEESVTLKIVRQNRPTNVRQIRPTKSSQVGVRVRVSHVAERVSALR